MQIKNSADFVEKIREFENVLQTKIAWGEKAPARLTQVAEEDNKLWMVFGNGEVDQHLTIPVPVADKNGCPIIHGPTCERVVGSWIVVVTSPMGEKRYLELSYWNLMFWILTERVEKYFPSSSKRNHLERLLRSFMWNSSALVFRSLQKIIDSVTTELPLKGTPMQAWAMSNRIQILDPDFDALTPKEALEYQRDLNERMFPMTSLGLSDSNMTKNVLLKVDVRETVPFGLAHHNPRRNLYQTLGMKGEEKPSIVSESEQKLAEQGIVRTGWNFVTAFVDMPDNFEDQIMVHEKHRNKFVVEHKNFISHGMLLVEQGDSLTYLDTLSIEPDGSLIKFDSHCDSAAVESITTTKINFDGKKTSVRVISVKMKKLFKDGFKLSNRHANKGVIFTTDTGYMEDPIRGRIPIDVIVSAKSVGKRKNYGQLVEAMCSLVNGPEAPIVVDNDYVAHIDSIKSALEEKGYRKDGTVDIDTQWGKFKAVCGWVFWGCIKTPEDQLWSRRDTVITNGKGVRKAGNKLSHIELKALTTIFGPNNPIVAEILEYKQGLDQVFGILDVLKGMRGEFPDGLLTLNWDAIRPIDQSAGFFHTPDELSGTISDETLHQNGFILQFPEDIVYVITEAEDGEILEQVFKRDELSQETEGIVLDKLLVLPSYMRKPWKHSSGKFGLNDMASLLNNILVSFSRWENGEEDISRVGIAIRSYFHTLSRSLGTKTGALSNYAMSVRYPYTSKATAVVRSDLEKNVVRIHESMALQLGVKTGDVVLVERFPCLGFMSLRAQKILVTNDPQAKFVIGVSGNSLSSLTLDFDGDVIYLMSFHNPDSKLALIKEFNAPHAPRKRAFEMSEAKKVPEFREMTLDDYNMEIFPPVTAEQNADIVEGLTGIKRGTGTVIALCYNLMRIIEKEVGYNDLDVSVALELLLDKIANSVFSRKHAGRSLEEECREAVCTASFEKMVNLGFEEEASKVLCGIIKKLAPEVGVPVSRLESYYEWATANNRSSVVNRIIRKFHPIWLTSRSNLHPLTILKNLKSEPVDLTSWMFVRAKEDWEAPIQKAA